MIESFTEEEFKKAKSKDKLSLQCESCKSAFYAKKGYIVYERKHKKNELKFCRHLCSRHIKTFCKLCNCPLDMTFAQLKSNHGNSFCSKSCAATYNNTHKTKGTRKSKLEVWLETKLTELYPDLEIHFNRKDAINSELDIYIPSLKLAFELNGIFHYEPIYGKDKLDKITNNDSRKFQACLEAKIELCIIDTSKEGYFKETNSKKYLDIIINIIDIKNSGCRESNSIN